MISLNSRKRIKEFMKLLNVGMSCPKNLALSLTVGVCLALFHVIRMTFLPGLMVAVVSGAIYFYRILSITSYLLQQKLQT